MSVFYCQGKEICIIYTATAGETLRSFKESHLTTATSSKTSGLLASPPINTSFDLRDLISEVDGRVNLPSSRFRCSLFRLSRLRGDLSLDFCLSSRAGSLRFSGR